MGLTVLDRDDGTDPPVGWGPVASTQTSTRSESTHLTGPASSTMDGVGAVTDASTPSRVPVGTVILLGGLSACGPLSTDMYLPGLPAMTAQLHTTPAIAQLSLTACLVGMAAGQLLAGAVSDALGRRRPLLVGLAVYTLVSVLCAVNSSAVTLVGLRLVQGLAAAAGIVIARAVVRDLRSGRGAVKLFAALMLVSGTAPILGPTLGAGLLKITSWRGIFVTMAVFGAVLLAASAIWLRETLPVGRRHTGGLRTTVGAFRALAADRAFLGYVLTAGLAFAALFSYISGSPYVLQDVFGLSQQWYGVVFGVNSLGIVGATQLSGLLVSRFRPEALVLVGLAVLGLSGVYLAAVAVAGLGLPAILIGLFGLVASIGLTMPHLTALALTDHPGSAGSASAMLGTGQFVIGALAAPVVGAAGTGTPVPMAVVIGVLGLGAMAMYLGLARPAARQTAPAL